MNNVDITYEMQKEWLLDTAASAVRAGQRAGDADWVADAQLVLDTIRDLPASEVALLLFDYTLDEVHGKRIALSDAPVVA